MFKWLIVSYALVSLLQETSAFTDGLRVRWGANLLAYGKDNFISMPRYVSEAQDLGWELVTGPSSVMSGVVTYSCDNRQISVHYDPDTNYAVGLQIGIPKTNITNSIYDFTTQGYTSWTVDINGVSEELWTLQVNLIDESTLQKSVEERQAIADANVTLSEDAVWVSGFNGELLKVSTDPTDIVDSGFTQQACIPLMGQHYFYGMSANTTCASDTLFTWFLLVGDGKLRGIGCQAIINMNTHEYGTKWFEEPGQIGVKLVVSDGPECLYNVADSVGVRTLHIYFIDDPWRMWTC